MPKNPFPADCPVTAIHERRGRRLIVLSNGGLTGYNVGNFNNDSQGIARIASKGEIAGTMIIYGVAILSLSMLAGLFIGDLLGIAIGVQANVGGVGIAMLILILLDNNPRKKLQLAPITAKGITFWSAMYIPIVVAMAAKQNVYGALAGGPLALLAGTLAVAGSFVLIPLMTKLGKGKQPTERKEQK